MLVPFRIPKQLLMLLDLIRVKSIPNWYSRNTGNDAVRRNVVGNHAAGSYDRSTSDDNTSHHNRPKSNPHIIFYYNL